MKRHGLVVVLNVVLVMMMVNTLFAEIGKADQLARLRKLRGMVSESYGIAVPEANCEIEGVAFKGGKPYLIKLITSEFVRIHQSAKQGSEIISISSRDFLDNFSHNDRFELIRSIDRCIDTLERAPSVSSQRKDREESRKRNLNRDDKPIDAPAGSIHVDPDTEEMTITTTDNVVYKNCRISRSEPDGITFIHSKGVSKIPFTRLPSEFAEGYDYNPQEATLYAKKIREARAEYMDKAKDMQRRHWRIESSRQGNSGNQSRGSSCSVEEWIEWRRRGGSSTGAGEFSKILWPPY